MVESVRLETNHKAQLFAGWALITGSLIAVARGQLAVLTPLFILPQ